MTKRFKQKGPKLLKLDLHGIKHDSVSDLVEDFILKNQENFPLKIITGNSDKMKKIVINILKTHDFKYSDGDYYNRGYINVLN